MMHLIKSFVEKNNGMQVIWSTLEVLEGDYKQLSKKLWIEIFKENDILEPIEELEQRFRIKRYPNKEDLAMLSNALEGNPILTEGVDIPVIKPKKAA